LAYGITWHLKASVQRDGSAWLKVVLIERPLHAALGAVVSNWECNWQHLSGLLLHQVNSSKKGADNWFGNAACGANNFLQSHVIFNLHKDAHWTLHED
jgi:hypothetical protein